MVGWPFDHLTGPIEPAAMARAVPGRFGGIPVHNAFHMRADCGEHRKHASFVAMNGELFTVHGSDPALPGCHVVEIVKLLGSQVILEQMLGNGSVLPGVLQRRLPRCDSTRTKARLPRVIATQYLVCDDGTGQRAPYQSIGSKAGGHVEVVVVVHSANVGQTIR